MNLMQIFKQSEGSKFKGSSQNSLDVSISQDLRGAEDINTVHTAAGAADQIIDGIPPTRIQDHLENLSVLDRLAPSAQPEIQDREVVPGTNQGGGQPLAPHANDRRDLSRPPGPQEGAPPRPDDEGAPPPHPMDGTPLPNVWIYDGEAYDLTEFIKKHPGGEFFIGRTKNRDITTIVNIFHRNPERVKKVLQKYSLNRKAKPEDIHPKYNAPAFLFYEGFDGWRDTPLFNFRDESHLMQRIKTRLNTPEMNHKVADMDRLFNWISVALVFTYVLVEVLRLGFTGYMPLYLFVPLMAVLRISLSGVGHYLMHRPQRGFNKLFTNIFDINYVPMAFVVTDGHSLMHHPYTESEVDIKKNVFTFMLELPRYYRIPVHTIHKVGHVLTGMFARTTELYILAFRAGVKDMYGSWWRGAPHFAGVLGMRVLLLGELIVFALHGDLLAWFLQFFVTLWISTFMIVASHDFEDERHAVDPSALRNWETQDWAIEQIKNSYDLTMLGNKYVDCFLSAGLSPHRVHHVLPQQKSGFANIISEAIVREEAEQSGLVWEEPKNFFLDRLPVLSQHYLGVPSRLAKEQSFGLLKEHFHPKALMTTLDYIIKGFAGIGSI